MTAAAQQSEKVAIGISSFRSDDQAFRLVKEIVSSDIPFHWIFVVDSMAGSRLGTRLAAIGEPRLSYHPEPQNIGSAGNLACRFEIADRLGADVLLAVNHDAPWCAEAMRQLVEVGRTLDGWGALYPLRFERGRAMYDISGTYQFPFHFRGARSAPRGRLVAVHWGSSNVALYAIARRPRHLYPDRRLWMGWEDYLYGLETECAGASQWMVTSAVIQDTYELRRHRVGGVRIATADKPNWYCYYGPRNLLLVHFHRVRTWRGIILSVCWSVAYGVRVLIFPVRGTLRLSLTNFLAGCRDGLMGRDGKWRLP